MTLSDAITIIESLANGIDPNTQQPLPTNAPYQTPDVIRSLFVALAELKPIHERRIQEAANPDRVGESWTADEDSQLCREFESGKSVSEIANAHQRTRGAIQSRLQRLGKITNR